VIAGDTNGVSIVFVMYCAVQTACWSRSKKDDGLLAE
jgi:hypothetical protein